MPDQVPLACMGLQTELWAPDVNLPRMEAAIGQAAERGAGFVVTPERALSRHAAQIERPIQWDAFLAAREPIDGARARTCTRGAHRGPPLRYCRCGRQWLDLLQHVPQLLFLRCEVFDVVLVGLGFDVNALDNFEAVAL